MKLHRFLMALAPAFISGVLCACTYNDALQHPTPLTHTLLIAPG